MTASTALAEDYFSPENSWKYMSVSQLKRFIECEAAAMAELRGEWVRKTTKAMLVGSYVDAAIEGEDPFHQFIAIHKDDIYNKKGEKYADFQQADKMIDALESDLYLMSMLSGDKQTIITGTLFGIEWRAKVDVLNPASIVDLKTVSKLRDKHWLSEQRRYGSFVEAFQYDLQMAVYSELERIVIGRSKRLPAYLVCVSKEEIPDKAALVIPDDVIEEELAKVEMMIGRVVAVKEGIASPIRCECCEYCRASKQVTGVIDFRELVV